MPQGRLDNRGYLLLWLFEWELLSQQINLVCQILNTYLSHFIACHSRAIAVGVHGHSVELLYPELFSYARIMNLGTPCRNRENGKAVCVFKKKKNHCWFWSICNCYSLFWIFLHLKGRKSKIGIFGWVAFFCFECYLAAVCLTSAGKQFVCIAVCLALSSVYLCPVIVCALPLVG